MVIIGSIIAPIIVSPGSHSYGNPITDKLAPIVSPGVTYVNNVINKITSLHPQTTTTPPTTTNNSTNFTIPPILDN